MIVREAKTVFGLYTNELFFVVVCVFIYLYFMILEIKCIFFAIMKRHS